MSVRIAQESDARAVAELRAAVAAEGTWLGAEAPVDIAAATHRFAALLATAGSTAFVATTSAGAVTGSVAVTPERPGVATLGMFVAAAHRGVGVGSALLAAAIEWGRAAGAHKMVLQVWPHNHAAIGLYQKFGFVAEGLLRRHARRRNGELWDVMVMGLLLDASSPGLPPS